MPDAPAGDAPALQLESLLLTLFSTGKSMKRELCSGSALEVLVAKLPADEVPPAEMANRIVVLLGEHGLIGDRLFEHLSAIRPHQRARIDAVAGAYAAALTHGARTHDGAGKRSWIREPGKALLLLLLLLLAGAAASLVWWTQAGDGRGGADVVAGQPSSPVTPAGAPRPATAGRESTRGDRLELTIRGVQTDAGMSGRGFLSHATLQSGDLFAFHVTANEPVYLYVLQYFADGTRRVLFPEEGDVQIAADVEVRVPAADDAWFRLDEAVGVENLYFLTSPRPLAGADPELASLVREIRVSPGLGSAPPSAAPPLPSPPPRDAMFMPLRAKGVYTMRVRNGVPVQQASFDRQTIGVVPFQIDHR